MTKRKTESASYRGINIEARRGTERENVTETRRQRKKTELEEQNKRRCDARETERHRNSL